MKLWVAVALLASAAGLGFAHRLDQYLEATIVSVEKSRVLGELTLTPGVAVYPIVIANIDINAHGVISETEQQSYAERVLRDLSASMDGRPLKLQLRSTQFPNIEEMKEGRGQIHLEFTAELHSGGINRSFVLENHHLDRIAAYQVNCLVPNDPGIRIVAQNRNYLQSHYELKYAQASAGSGSMLGWIGAAAILLVARVAWLWRHRASHAMA